MKIDIKETANKVRQFGGKWHPRQKGSDSQKRRMLQQKCDALGIAVVLEGEI